MKNFPKLDGNHINTCQDWGRGTLYGLNLEVCHLRKRLNVEIQHEAVYIRLGYPITP